MVWAWAAAPMSSRLRARWRTGTASVAVDGAVIERDAAVGRHRHRPERGAVAAGGPGARPEALILGDLELGLVADRRRMVVGDGEAMILPVAPLIGLLERHRHAARFARLDLDVLADPGIGDRSLADQQRPTGGGGGGEA